MLTVGCFPTVNSFNNSLGALEIHGNLTVDDCAVTNYGVIDIVGGFGTTPPGMCVQDYAVLTNEVGGVIANDGSLSIDSTSEIDNWGTLYNGYAPELFIPWLCFGGHARQFRHRDHRKRRQPTTTAS